MASPLAKQVQGEAVRNVVSGADAIDGLLHFAIAAIAAFHRVGGGTEQAVIQEGQRLFQIGREQALSRLAALA